MMKFTQLIEYNIWNIFPEKSYIKYSGESIPRPFSKKKKQIWGYLRINSLKFCRVCLYCMPSWGLPKYIETKLLTTWFYPFQPFLKKRKKRGLRIVSLLHFLHGFWRIFILISSINWPKFIVYCSFNCEILVNIHIVIVD